MLLEHEAARCEARDIGGAAGDVVDAVARSAVKVVVMALAGALVAGGLPGKADGLKPALIDQGSDGAIDGGDAQPGDALAGSGEDLSGPQRPIGGFEDLAKGAALAGVSARR